uniref:NAD-dependent protein deacetylase n=1 Tax=Panagrellus redivivus TaxID=6233 RepID=A0A7E4UTU6_PANRE
MIASTSASYERLVQGLILTSTSRSILNYDIISQLVKEKKRRKRYRNRRVGCLKSFSIDGIADYIQKYNPKNIIFMVGAGISTSAGIPDFRTPGTGLYDNLAKYNLPAPELIFSIDLFRENPIPFFDLAKDLFMSDAKPTLAHYFMRLMTEKGHVRRIYTQNIDTLEYMAGTPPDKVITAHGSHYSNTCQKCRAKYDQQWMIDHFYRAQDLVATCTKCKGVVKPDIVFFGENLPLAFYQNVGTDFDACDLLIIMGTSLVVYPVAGIVDSVKSHTPRLLINLEPAGAKHLRYHKKHGNKRDVFYQSSADDGCRKLAELLGYLPELEQLMAHEIKKLDQQRKEKPKKLAPSGSILLRNN